MKIITTFLIMTVFFIMGTAQQVSLSFKELAYAGNTGYGTPAGSAHCLAVWITDNANGFVKTVFVNAGTSSGKSAATPDEHEFEYFLIKWKEATPIYDRTDAVTGASLESYPATPRTITWDCKNLKGEIVPDGNYTIHVEQQAKNDNNSSPYFSITFTKGPTGATINPPASTPTFENTSIKLQYTAPSAIHNTSSTSVLKFYPNPASEKLQIEFSLENSNPVDFKLFGMNGALLFEKKIQATAGVNHENISLENLNLAAGTYFISLATPAYSFGETLIVE